jgi:hypothetical protein
VVLFDIRNGRILDKIYATGKAIELELHESGFYTGFAAKAKIRYGYVIKALGVLLDGLALALGIIWSIG